MKLKFLSKNKLVEPCAVKISNGRMLTTTLQMYARQRIDSNVSFVRDQKDRTSCITLNSIPFVFCLIDSRINIRTYFPQVRCLGKNLIQDLEKSHVYVDWNHSNQAGLSQVLNIEFLMDETALYSQLDFFVEITRQLVEIQNKDQRIYRLSSGRQII